MVRKVVFAASLAVSVSASWVLKESSVTSARRSSSGSRRSFQTVVKVSVPDDDDGVDRGGSLFVSVL